MDKELISEIKKMTSSEIALDVVAKQLNLNKFEVMGMINYLKQQGLNIVTIKKDDGIYLLNQGERNYNNDYKYQFSTDPFNKISFLVISDTRMGSIFFQKSILNELYTHAYEMGVTNVLLVGNLTEGLYKMSDNMVDTLVAKDTMGQAKYVIDNYPYIEGMKTYFITGKKDQTHLTINKIDIGNKIASARKDMIYIGNSRCDIKIDNVDMLILNRKQQKTYTQSYRAQKMIDALRSENKPDILLYGGLLQSEEYTYRDVQVLSIPSVCASTWEMEDKEYSNAIGGWIINITTNEKGELQNLETLNDIYYKTFDNDCLKAKTLKRVRDK